MANNGLLRVRDITMSLLWTGYRYTIARTTEQENITDLFVEGMAFTKISQLLSYWASENIFSLKRDFWITSMDANWLYEIPAEYVACYAGSRLLLTQKVSITGDNSLSFVVLQRLNKFALDVSMK
jgi:hypothetical protein